MKKQSKIIIVILLTCVLLSVILLLINNMNILQNNDTFTDENTDKILNCEILDESLKLGTQFLMNNQRSGGNFNYEYDWINKNFNTEDNEVRQAGALWGIALIYNNNPDGELKESFKKGFEFFHNFN